MAIPLTAVGTKIGPLTSTVERGRLAFFAKAIGEIDPVYSDIEAARAAGHPDLPVPPTFMFGLLLETPDPFAWLTDIGVDLRLVLHGSQSFTYHAPAHAGDELTVLSEITDVYAKKGGALEFVVRRTKVTRGQDPVATLTETLVVRHPVEAAA